MIFTFIHFIIRLNVMSLKYSSTTADYLQWSEAMNLIRKLAKDGNYKISLLVALGCFTGLRISDILALRWKQILDAEEFTVIEIKTGKQRTVRINMQLQKHICDCYKHISPIGIDAPILVSRKGTVYSIQRINVVLKEVKRKYRLHIGNFSCHSLRKTFGRQVYNMNSESSELALVKLMELFNHSSVSITKRYLGLRQEELLNTYDCLSFDYWRLRSPIIKNGVEQPFKPIIQVGSKFLNFYLYRPFTNLLLTLIYGVGMPFCI